MLKEMTNITESGAETIQRVLSAYEIGRKIRQLRLKKKMGLVDLGGHTGLSASMLSQLENGKMVPTLPTLARISMVFDVGIDHFFSDRAKKTRFSVVRAAERIKFPERADAPQPAFHFECLAFSSQEKSMQAYLATFEPRELKQVSPHVHEGSEFIHVMEGVLGVMYQDEETELGAGDSAYFDSSQEHGYRGVGGGQARALVVTTAART
jgi:transcriptional regulator with XRE-family HTH domain